MNDIVDRLLASVTQCRAVDRSELLAEAAAEIERLRLTDAERYALRDAAESFEFDDDDKDCARVAATLRGLLERMK